MTNAGAPVVNKGDRIQIIDTNKTAFDEGQVDTAEIMTVTDVNKDSNSVTVDPPGSARRRPTAHKAGDQVIRPAVPADPPSITGKDSAPSCGQNAPAAAAPSPTPAADADGRSRVGELDDRRRRTPRSTSRRWSAPPASR